jgi:hypothetical protein
MASVPDELVALVAERRLIPFVGAGFSDALGLPTWEAMLRSLTERIDGAIEFDELMELTGRDYLQIAEYLFLKCDRHIGPIRHELERSLVSHGLVSRSSPHVELANLRAPQIYTTNYDDLIEGTYRELGVPVSVVVLPKDVALAKLDRTQVVKYHGDLQHESTLVLTESAYYRRLDFESPMDLKFRSDLLGRSVLFMGYSFRDVNIRVIWFKLMEMMTDVPEADRTPSFILRIEPNAALEALYEAVGLRTIVLNTSGTPAGRERREALLSDFLLSLSMQANGAGPRRKRPHSQAYVSLALLKAVDDWIGQYGQRSSAHMRVPRRLFIDSVGNDERVSRLLQAKVPASLLDETNSRLVRVLPYVDDTRAIELLRRLPSSPELTAASIDLFSERGEPETRDLRLLLFADRELWSKIFDATIDEKRAQALLEEFAAELIYQAGIGADEDIIFLSDLVARLASGQLVLNPSAKMVALAKSLLEQAALVYPSIASLRPEPNTPPFIQPLLAEVTKRSKKFVPVSVKLPEGVGGQTIQLRSRAPAARRKSSGSS